MVMKVDNPLFIDANILVYANVAEPPFNSIAVKTLTQLYQTDVELWISRQILREYLAVVTRPQDFSNPQPFYGLENTY